MPMPSPPKPKPKPKKPKAAKPLAPDCRARAARQSSKPVIGKPHYDGSLGASRNLGCKTWAVSRFFLTSV